MFIELLATTLLLHFVADFVLQIPAQVRRLKRTSALWVALHALLWTALISLGLAWFSVLALWKPLFLASTHFVIDLYRCRKIKNPATWQSITADQLLHIFSLLVIVVF